MEERPNYYAIIPAEVRYDNDLRAGAKIFYGEITALCSKYGVCTASNNYFAELYDMTPSGITHWVTQLKNKGYISVEYEKEGKVIKQRKIIINNLNSDNYVVDRVLTNINRVVTNVNRGTDKSLGGYLQKDKENNTSINNTSINNNKRKYKKKSQYNDIINSLIDNNEVKEVLIDFIEMRDLIKKPMTDRALKQLINKLKELSKNKGEQIKILDQSIINNWASIYPLKQEQNKPKTAYEKRQEMYERFLKEEEHD